MARPLHYLIPVHSKHFNSTLTMKFIRILTLSLSAAALTLTAVSCKEEKGPAGKIGDKIDDALDNRPAEGVRDAVEKVVE